MSLRIELRKEFETVPAGTYAPYYYRYLGQRDHLGEPVAIIRANGIYSLFANTPATIYKNDLIAGNKKGAYIEKENFVLDHAMEFTSNIGERTFRTNKDHYAPNYEKLLSVGITGIMEEIDASLKAYAADEKKCETLSAMKTAFSGFIRMIEKYAEKAEALRDTAEYNNDRLDFIVSNCEMIAKGRPQTFAQALQLVWLCHMHSFLREEQPWHWALWTDTFIPFTKKMLKPASSQRNPQRSCWKTPS